MPRNRRRFASLHTVGAGCSSTEAPNAPALVPAAAVAGRNEDAGVANRRAYLNYMRR